MKNTPSEKWKSFGFYTFLFPIFMLMGFVYMNWGNTQGINQIHIAGTGLRDALDVDQGLGSQVARVAGATLLPFLLTIAFISRKEKNKKLFIKAIFIGIALFSVLYFCKYSTESIKRKENDKQSAKIQLLFAQYQDLISQNRLEESLKISDEILSIKDIPEAHFFKGHSLEGLKKYDLAIKEFSIVINSESNLADYALFHRGTIYLLSKKDRQRGCDDIKKANSILMRPTTTKTVKEQYIKLLESCK